MVLLITTVNFTDARTHHKHTEEHRRTVQGSTTNDKSILGLNRNAFVRVTELVVKVQGWHNGGRKQKISR